MSLFPPTLRPMIRTKVIRSKMVMPINTGEKVLKNLLSNSRIAKPIMNAEIMGRLVAYHNLCPDQ